MNQYIEQCARFKYLLIKLKSIRSGDVYIPVVLWPVFGENFKLLLLTLL